MNMKDNKQRIWFGIVFGICLIIAVFLIGRRTRPVQVDGGYREVMGTFARIVVVADDAQQARDCIEAGFDELKRIDAMMSDYKADSELSKVNRSAFAGPVRVSGELFGLLQKSVEFSRLPNGAFDITVGPLVDLWRKAGEVNAMPDENSLAEARSRVGYEKLLLDANERTVRFAVDGMRLDLGGIAKGYSVDKAVEIMKQKGAIAGMVDSGGNIYCFGKPLGKSAWLVGVQDPRTANSEDLPEFETGQVLMVLKLKDTAVATSGDYRRFVTVGGKKVSHIIDTNTATGAHKLAGDTIIAKTAMDADAISTIVNVLGPGKGLALIGSLPNVECILITQGPEYRIIKSKGASVYIR
ncbi:MAG: FAD:protein FMN transferase [Planctomycetota bacterium]